MSSAVAGNFFEALSDSKQYAICDDLWLCSVEYSACVSGFWGLCRPPDPLFCPPLQIPGYAPICTEILEQLNYLID